MKGMDIITDNMKAVIESIGDLVNKSVLVGIPASEAERDDNSPMDNATLGYLHETGSPAANIPARPFLVPGVTDSQAQYEPQLKKAVQAALSGQKRKINQHLDAAGLIASQAVKNTLDVANFAPLSISTLRARARKGRKGAAAELASRAAGNAPNNANAKPLTDSGEMRNAVTYILRDS